MALKYFKPTTPARRRMARLDTSKLSDNTPPKKLRVSLKKKAGRNNHGKITVRHRGGGEKRFYRIIDFKQDKYGIPGVVETIEYDPNRTSNIAKIKYIDGERRYILSIQGMKVGDKILSSQEKDIEIEAGNRLPLKFVPAGMMVCNIELSPGKGGEMARSAGACATTMGLEGKYCQLKMPSGEIRKVLSTCDATVGVISNEDHKNERIGKAGCTRRRGRRPTVRGKAMNAVDHPHGGGEGGSPIGLKAPKTKWGKKALGVRTRKKKKRSSKLIVKRRGKK